MTQGFPAQPPQGYAPPVQPQYGQPPQQFTPPGPVPQYQQGAGNPAGGFFTQQDPAYQAQQQYAMAQQGPVVPAPPATQIEDTSGFFGGGASISWDDRKGYVKGTFRGGQIISKQITNQTKMGTNEIIRWDNGDPRKQMELTLQTTERTDPQDDGKRRLFIKGDLPRASREAMKKVNANDLSVGGWFYAAWISEKPATKVGFNDSKIFDAIYAPPGAPDPRAGQPAYVAAAVPAPQPGQGADQFAAYAAYQQQMAAHQASAQPPAPPQQAPPGVPADQAAQFAAWQASQQQPSGQVPPAQQPSPGAAPPWNPYA